MIITRVNSPSPFCPLHQSAPKNLPFFCFFVPPTFFSRFYPQNSLGPFLEEAAAVGPQMDGQMRPLPPFNPSKGKMCLSPQFFFATIPTFPQIFCPSIPPSSAIFLSPQMDRCSPLALFAALVVFLLNLPIPALMMMSSPSSSPLTVSSSGQSSSSSFRYSDIIAKRVRVVVDPIRVVLDETLANMSKKERPVCVLALHRDECQGPRVKPNERIGWQDRLCLVWRCLRADKLAMRVQDCWAGSGKSPILLIDQDGCTRESSMLSTPHYRPLNQSAHSLGWLTVRLPHLDHIRLSCALKFCPICDPFCRQQIPPIECADSAGKGGEKWWREKIEAEEGKGLHEMCEENADKIDEEMDGRNGGLREKRAMETTLMIWLGIFIKLKFAQFIA